MSQNIFQNISKSNKSSVLKLIVDSNVALIPGKAMKVIGYVRPEQEL